MLSKKRFPTFDPFLLLARCVRDDLLAVLLEFLGRRGAIAEKPVGEVEERSTCQF